MSWFGWTGRMTPTLGGRPRPGGSRAAKPAAPDAVGFLGAATPGDEATAPGRPRHRARTGAPAYSRAASRQGPSPACGQLSLLVQERAYGPRGCSGSGRTAGPPATYGAPDPPSAPPPAPLTEDDSTQRENQPTPSAPPTGRSTNFRPDSSRSPGTGHVGGSGPENRTHRARSTRPCRPARPSPQTARRRTPTAPISNAGLQQSEASHKPPNTRGHNASVVDSREPGPPDCTMAAATSTRSRPSPMGPAALSVDPAPATA